MFKPTSKLVTLRKRPLALLFLGLALTLLLSACRVYVKPGQVSVHGHVSFGIPLANIITSFQPDRGQGATYTVGENVAFRIRTTSNGYITLTALDPDGSIYVFGRNIYVRGGVSNLITGPDSRHQWTLTPPRGLQRVRASFTPSPTNTSRVIYRGRSGANTWTQSIVTDIKPFPANARDIAQTYFYIQ